MKDLTTTKNFGWFMLMISAVILPFYFMLIPSWNGSKLSVDIWYLDCWAIIPAISGVLTVYCMIIEFIYKKLPFKVRIK